jgi:uncharacterized membrane protein
VIEILIQLLILFVVLAVIWWVIRLVAAHFGAPAIIVQVAGLILFLIWLLYAVRAFGGGHFGKLLR